MFWDQKFYSEQVMDDILLLGSGSVDPHIFIDPDPEPGSQNVVALKAGLNTWNFWIVKIIIFVVFNFRSQKLENVSIALKFLENEGVHLVNIDSTGTPDSILKGLWA